VVFTDDCDDGPVTVTSAGGRRVEFPGPVCPGQEIRVSDRTVELLVGTSIGDRGPPNL